MKSWAWQRNKQLWSWAPSSLWVNVCDAAVYLWTVISKSPNYHPCCFLSQVVGIEEEDVPRFAHFLFKYKNQQKVQTEVMGGSKMRSALRNHYFCILYHCFICLQAVCAEMDGYSEKAEEVENHFSSHVTSNSVLPALRSFLEQHVRSRWDSSQWQQQQKCVHDFLKTRWKFVSFMLKGELSAWGSQFSTRGSVGHFRGQGLLEKHGQHPLWGQREGVGYCREQDRTLPVRKVSKQRHTFRKLKCLESIAFSCFVFSVRGWWRTWGSLQRLRVWSSRMWCWGCCCSRIWVHCLWVSPNVCQRFSHC